MTDVGDLIDWLSVFDEPSCPSYVVLDIGGVLTPDPWEAIVQTPGIGLADQLGIPTLSRFAEFLWRQHSLSTTNEVDYWQSVGELAGCRIPASLVAEVEAQVLRAFPWASELLDSISVPAGVVSDNTSFWFAKQSRLLDLEARNPWPRLLSFECGVSKGDRPRGLFDLLAEVLPAASTLVIDDRDVNIRRASSLGFRTHTFRPGGN